MSQNPEKITLDDYKRTVNTFRDNVVRAASKPPHIRISERALWAIFLELHRGTVYGKNLRAIQIQWGKPATVVFAFTDYEHNPIGISVSARFPSRVLNYGVSR